MVKRSFRRKRFCERHPRSESCKKKADKKVKPYSGGKLNIDEICHNCSVSYYAKSARRFCKSHGKVWNQKTNSCRDKKKRYSKTKKQKGVRQRTLNNLTPEQLEYFKEFPNLTAAGKKKLLKDPCWPSIETPECVKLMVKDNPWMLEKGGDKYAQKVVGKKSLLNKEIKKKKRSSKTKKQKGGALCVPCISPILSGLGVLGAGAAATAAGAMTMTSSKLVQSGNNIEREQSFEKNTSKTHKKGKKSKKETDKLKFYISQKNNKVSFKKNNGKLDTKTFNKSKNMKTNIKQASQFYDKKIKYCVVKGYKKC